MRVEWWTIITCVLLLPSLGPPWVVEPPALWGLVLWEQCTETLRAGCLKQGRLCSMQRGRACSKPGLAKAQLQGTLLCPSTSAVLSLAGEGLCRHLHCTVLMCPKGSKRVQWNVWQNLCRTEAGPWKEKPSALNGYINYSGKQHQRAVLWMLV